MHSPILFLVFNRPECTKRVFRSIQQAKPPRLYVAADGPRGGAEERQRAEEVRRIATSVDWPCEVRTLYRVENLGCKKAVSGGISWFFEHEEHGVILEDDVLPDPSFFVFCDELLDRFRDDQRIMMISGSYFHGRRVRIDASYFFSRYTHIWGWATWRRAWRYYDSEMTEWPKLRETDFLLGACDGDPHAAAYWRRVFDAVYDGLIDTWDYQWLFTAFQRAGLSVLPTRNLVRNLGFSTDATHTKDGTAWLGQLRSHSMSFPLRHPAAVTRDTARDRWVEQYVFGSNRSMNAGIRRWISRLPGMGQFLATLSGP